MKRVLAGLAVAAVSAGYLLRLDGPWNLVPLLSLPLLFYRQVSEILCAQAAVWRGVAKSLQDGGPVHVEISGLRLKFDRQDDQREPVRENSVQDGPDNPRP